MDAGGLIQGECDGDGGDGEIGEAEGVGDLEADLGSTDRDLEGLADGGVHKDGARLVLKLCMVSGVYDAVERELTNGAGGRLAGSVNWGIEAHVSIHRPLRGFG